MKIINAVEEGKFPLLLNRIVQFLCNGSSSKPFTSIEEEKLENSFEITKSEVQMLVDGIIEIFRTCAYHVVKPQILSEQLQKGLSMSAKKTEMFVQSWAASARGIVDNLRQRIYFPQVFFLPIFQRQLKFKKKKKYELLEKYYMLIT